MPIEVVVESLDAVPETLREHYVEKDGKHVLDVSTDSLRSYFEPETKGLKSALEKERENAKAANAALKNWQALGFDSPEDAKTAIDEATKNKGKALSQEEIEDLVQKRAGEVVSAKDKELQEKDGQLNETRSLLDKLVVGDHIKTAALKAGVDETMLDFVTDQAAKHGWTRDGEKAVLKKDGSIVFGSELNTPMTPDEWMPKLIEQYPLIVKESKGPGGQHQNNTSGASTNKKASEMSRAEKSAFISKYSLQAWNEKIANENG